LLYDANSPRPVSAHSIVKNSPAKAGKAVYLLSAICEHIITFARTYFQKNN